MKATDIIDIVDIANEMIAFEEMLALEELLEMPAMEPNSGAFAFADR
jgi:hypothetical protein